MTDDKVKIGITDMEIDFDMKTQIDKAMSYIFDVDMDNPDTEKNYPVVDVEKPGMATVFKQVVMFIGDVISFLCKLVKQTIEQIINSFFLPILSAGLPFTTPLLLKKVFDIIKGIISMIKEVISMVSKPMDWVLEKVGGKILSIKVPIPKFDIPLFGLKISIPQIDPLGLMKLEPFTMLPTEKITEINKLITNIQQKINYLPPNNITTKNILEEKLKEFEIEKKKLSKIQNDDINSLFNEIQDLQYQLSLLKEADNTAFLETTLKAMEECLNALKYNYFKTILELIDLIIEVHNNVIIKKKDVLNSYLNNILNNKETNKQISITLGDINTLINQGIIFNSDDFTINIVNTDINYVYKIINLSNVNFISYKFNDRLDIYQKEKDELEKNRTIIKKYKNKKGKDEIVYSYTGDFDHLNYVYNFIIEEIQKEEFELEELIDKYNLEETSIYGKQLKEFTNFLNKPFIKKLETSEQYITPVFTEEEKKYAEKIGQKLPASGIKITEVTVSGYTERIFTLKTILDSAKLDIKDLEKSIDDFKTRISEIPQKAVETTPTTKSKEEQKLETDIKKKTDDILLKSPSSIVNIQKIEVLKGIIKFPIDIIIGLITTLMIGIIDFITNLPLLKFDTLIQFFKNLLGLPNPKVLTDTMNAVVENIGIPSDYIRPVTNMVNVIPAASADVMDRLIKEKVLESIPFTIDIPPLSRIETLNIVNDDDDELILEEPTSEIEEPELEPEPESEPEIATEIPETVTDNIWSNLKYKENLGIIGAPLSSKRYYAELHYKNQIVIHHTASGPNIIGDLESWEKRRDKVCTPFIIDRLGNIYETYDYRYYSNHLGDVKNVGTLHKHSISIELDSWGWLKYDSKKSKYINWTGNDAHLYDSSVTSYINPYRKEKYYEKYTDAQLKSLGELLIYLSHKTNIPLTDHTNIMFNVNNSAISGNAGIWTHASYRSDKTDCHPQPELIEMLKAISKIKRGLN